MHQRPQRTAHSTCVPLRNDAHATHTHADGASRGDDARARPQRPHVGAACGGRAKRAYLLIIYEEWIPIVVVVMLLLLLLLLLLLRLRVLLLLRLLLLLL